MEIEWSTYLKIHYPDLSKVYLNHNGEKRINKQLEKRNSQILECLPENYSANFYDQFVRIINSEIGNKRERNVAESLLSQINTLVKELIIICKENKIPITKLKNQLSDLFGVNGAKYLDKVGELLSTIYLLRSNSNYRLLDLEFKHEPYKKRNSKDSDLLIYDSSKKGKILIDIFNINLDYKKIENDAGLEKTLCYRIGDKHLKKGYNEPESIKSYKKAIIQPIVWIYDIETIIKYQNLFENFTIHGSLPILFLRQRSNEKRNVYYDCVEAKNILK